jgi:type II secretory ATPase GspE/PulE/Tfp pilus assembly ATPase PilB-like protein
VSHAVLKDLCDTEVLPQGLPDPTPVFEPVGCQRCGGLGYRGRVGVYELLTMSETIQRMAVEGSSSEVMMRQARSEGMRTLLEDGLLKVIGGMTSLEELARAIG